MTISESLKLASSQLKTGHINNPHLEAEILLSAVLKKPREFILAHGEVLLSKKQITKYQRLLKRRFESEPIAYLIKHKEFYGLDFIVNKNVLIPRPETELLVEETLKLITRSSSTSASRRPASTRRKRGERDGQPATLIDVGTGSGCIIITLAKLLGQELRIMNHELWGIDISAKALAAAKQNAKIHGVGKKIKFLKGNLLKPIIDNSKFVILANLPYGWPAWKNNYSLNTIGLKFEPKIALFTNKQGLGLYEKLFRQIKGLRAASCKLRDIRVLCEFDPRQTNNLKKLTKKYLPNSKVEIKKDLAGLNRLAIIKNWEEKQE